MKTIFGMCVSVPTGLVPGYIFILKILRESRVSELLNQFAIFESLFFFLQADPLEKKGSWSDLKFVSLDIC